MVKVGKCALMHKKWTSRVELTKKTSHCKSRDFLRKRRLKIGFFKKMEFFSFGKSLIVPKGAFSGRKHLYIKVK